MPPSISSKSSCDSAFDPWKKNTAQHQEMSRRAASRLLVQLMPTPGGLARKIEAKLTDRVGHRHGLVVALAHVLSDAVRCDVIHDALEKAGGGGAAEVLEQHPGWLPDERVGSAVHRPGYPEPVKPFRDLLSPAIRDLGDSHVQQPPQLHAARSEYTLAPISLTSAHVCFSTSALARRAMRTARSGSSSRPVMALTSAAGSSGETMSPVSPSRTIAAMSPMPVDTTGSPDANDSRTETG